MEIWLRVPACVVSAHKYCLNLACFPFTKSSHTTWVLLRSESAMHNCIILMLIFAGVLRLRMLGPPY